MMKNERHEQILTILNKEKSVKVSALKKTLNVTEMTIRRDLQELEKSKNLIRVHGGAVLYDKNNALTQEELTHNEKRQHQASEKKNIAQKIAKIIHNNDTVFIGAGTTLENVYDYLTIENAKIITNSIHVFNRFRHDSRFELILIGGTYRPVSGAFVGTLANDFIDKIKVQKAFIGVNGIFDEGAYTANEDEGLTNRHIIKAATEKYIVADQSKFEQRYFYRFADIKDINEIITNDGN